MNIVGDLINAQEKKQVSHNIRIYVVHRKDYVHGLGVLELDFTTKKFGKSLQGHPLTLILTLSS